MPRLRALRHLQRHSETSPTRRTAGAQPFLDSPTKSHRATGTPCASWRALLVLALLEVVVVFGWVSLSSIPSEATAFFGISTSELDLTLNWGPAVNLIFAYPASQYLDRSGVRAAALTAGRLAMVSAGLRALPCILGASFRSSGWCLPMLHLGSALFAGPIINTVPTLFSSLYFTDEWRGTATAIVANSAAMGGAASFFAGRSASSTSP